MTKRSDGRSDRRVIADLIALTETDDIVPYDALIELLQEDVIGREITRRTVGAAVRAGNVLALEECQRYFEVVPRVGYRLVPAAEHSTLALTRRRRADNQMRKGLLILQHVRWNELQGEERRKHEGILIWMSGVTQAIESLNARQDHLEQLVARISGEPVTSGPA